MHDLLFDHQNALADDDLRRYASELELGVSEFDAARVSAEVLMRVERDVESGRASGKVLGTPTLFIDGVVHRGGYDVPSLIEALEGEDA
jgi:formate-nitrite transporter family protein